MVEFIECLKEHGFKSHKRKNREVRWTKKVTQGHRWVIELRRITPSRPTYIEVRGGYASLDGGVLEGGPFRIGRLCMVGHYYAPEDNEVVERTKVVIRAMANPLDMPLLAGIPEAAHILDYWGRDG